MSTSDPYRNFRFRVRFDDRPVAGFSKAAGLGDKATGPSPDARHRIVLERGLTEDQSFASWANAAATPTGAVRRDLSLEVLNEAGDAALTFAIVGAWVSEYQALPDLDGGANAIVIEHLVIDHEGLSTTGDGGGTERG